MNIRINFLLILVLVCGFFLSCSSDTNPVLPCGVIDPVKKLDWMKEVVNDIESSNVGRETAYILRGRYNGETVFVSESCCMYCYWVPVFYNCQGEQLTELNFNNIETSDWKVIWKSSENTCELD